jgi:plasmid stability protein
MGKDKVVDGWALSIYMSKDLVEGLRVEAAYHQMSRSEFCRKILDTAVKRSQRERESRRATQ